MLPLFASEWCTKASRVNRARKEWSHPDWEDVPEGHATRDVLMAFAMGSHGRVGAASPIRNLDENLMYQIVTCYLRVPIVVPDDCRFLPPPLPPCPAARGRRHAPSEYLQLEDKETSFEFGPDSSGVQTPRIWRPRPALLATGL